MNKNSVILDDLELDQSSEDRARTRNKSVGIVLFVVAAALGLLRIVAFFLSDILDSLEFSPLENEYTINALFTVFSQIVVCFLLPLLIYILYQKNSAKQVFLDSNFKKPNALVMLLCIPLGVGFYFMTIYLVNYWLSLLINTGYTYTPSYSLYPKSFNPLLFLLSIFLTAVLPAFCEEFLMRGMFLTALKKSFGTFGTILLAGVAFGLFHQNIIQLFYTAVFGGFMAFLVLRTGSIYPAMVVHFVNNAISVYLGYDDYYGWGVAKAMQNALNVPYIVILFFIIGVGIIAGTAALIIKLTKKDSQQKPPLVLYKPSVRENSGHIGAIFIAASATLFTFLFGFIL